MSITAALAEFRQELADHSAGLISHLKEESSKVRSVVETAKAKATNEVADLLAEFAQFTNGGPV